MLSVYCLSFRILGFMFMVNGRVRVMFNVRIRIVV